MAVQPLPRARPDGPRLMSAGQARRPKVPGSARIARRRLAVTWAKRLLPVLALMLLASIALWPEFDRMRDQGRIAFRRTFNVEPDAIRMTEPRYHGVDVRGRPYTLTAATALQVDQNRVDLAAPKADLTLESGAWMLVQSNQGVYIQHAGLLDLSGDATLYRDDGTVMRSQTATLELKTGAAASNDQTHVEGPFGVLDAQGFTLVDKGAVIQFVGPARLVINGSRGQ